MNCVTSLFQLVLILRDVSCSGVAVNFSSVSVFFLRPWISSSWIPSFSIIWSLESINMSIRSSSSNFAEFILDFLMPCCFSKVEILIELLTHIQLNYLEIERIEENIFYTFLNICHFELVRSFWKRDKSCSNPTHSVLRVSL